VLEQIRKEYQRDTESYVFATKKNRPDRAEDVKKVLILLIGLHTFQFEEFRHFILGKQHLLAKIDRAEYEIFTKRNITATNLVKHKCHLLINKLFEEYNP